MICQTMSSYNWFLCFHSLDTYTSEFKLHLGIMATGAINVVRGSRSSAEELLLIYNHSNRLGNICFNLCLSTIPKTFISDVKFKCDSATISFIGILKPWFISFELLVTAITVLHLWWIILRCTIELQNLLIPGQQ